MDTDIIYNVYDPCIQIISNPPMGEICQAVSKVVTTDPFSPGPATHRDTVQAGAIAVVEGWPQKMTAAW